MRTVTEDRASTQRLLELAHRCVSGVLQFDYLSNGAGHLQSTALLKSDAPGSGNFAGGRSAAARRGRASPARVSAKAATNAPARELQTGISTVGHDIVRRYLTEIAARRRLSSSEEYRLARSARIGDPTARRQLIEHHLGLVVVLARRYRNRGLPLLDLIEEGNIGLMAAIRKFDPEMGHRFSTYAKWWIRQSIELALMTQTRVVHVPVHVTRALRRRSKKTDGHSGPEPYCGDARKSAVPAGPRILRGAAKFLLHDASDRADSAQRSGRESEAIIETLPAPESEQPEARLLQLGQRRRLHEALALLNENERLVIQSRFGLGDDTTRTLEHIAGQLKLSSERVRQIQAEAVLKLRRLLLLKQRNGQDSLL